VVAVRDGILMRAPSDKALYLVADGPGEHIRFRYLHMDPDRLDRAGMVSGRHVSAGEVIGTVGNYGRRAGGTTYHLHFDMQVMSRDGWVFVSPYMTLISAYERLIGGRGQVVRDAPDVSVTTASIGTAAAEPTGPPNAIVASGESTHEHKNLGAEQCTTRFVKGHRRRLCELARAEGGKRGRGAAVRSVGRSLSAQSAGPRHYRGDLHARHARNTSRHGRA
jgi:murein DD-endopeptidase MepM/ murein hydrolase activator NlpD